MIGNKYQDCELACFDCGKKSDLMQVAHRDMNDFVVGYLFLCNLCLARIGGNYSVFLSEIQRNKEVATDTR